MSTKPAGVIQTGVAGEWGAQAAYVCVWGGGGGGGAGVRGGESPGTSTVHTAL